MVGNKTIIRFIKVLFFFLLIGVSGQAAPFKFLHLTVTQPNGDTLALYASGDEYYNWLHDAEGYTILLGDNGYYYYAEKAGDSLVASPYRVDQTTASTLTMEKWLKKKITLSSPHKSSARSTLSPQPNQTEYAPRKGRLNNIVIFITFNDDDEFVTPRSTFDNKFNNTAGPSLLHYYQEVSYNRLEIKSSYFPVCGQTTNLSYKDNKNRSYYLTNQGGNTNGYAPDDDFEKLVREHGLLKRAINALKPQIESTFTAAELDEDGDGKVDNVCFVIKGNSEGWGGLLWAHRWTLYSENVRLHGKRVYDYVFQPENQVDVRTLCHEMFHSLGAPDLYHYSYDGLTPVGVWDLMENSDAHMSAYMKWKYAGQKWISKLPEINCSGTYSLRPLTDSINNCYKIPLSGTGNQFLVLEYRKKTGLYESTLPGSGLLIYRIDPDVTEGNRNGPPDEVYIYRQGGTFINDGDINKAAFSANDGRTEFNIHTDPYPFLDSENIANISISDVGFTDDSITFSVKGLICGNTIVDSSLIYTTDTVCQGVNAQLSIDMVDKIGPCIYLWEPVPAGSFNILNANTNRATVPTRHLAPGTYWMEVTVTDQGEMPSKVRKDTVSFYVRELPRFSIKPQGGDYCMNSHAIKEGDFSWSPQVSWPPADRVPECFDKDLLNQGFKLEYIEAIYSDLDIGCLSEKIIEHLGTLRYEENIFSTENGVLGGTPPYRYNWRRCDNNGSKTEYLGAYSIGCHPPILYATYRHPVTGEIVHRNGRYCADIVIEVKVGDAPSTPSEEQTSMRIYPGCNCIQLTVSDAHGCYATQSTNPTGHQFTSKSIKIENAPLKCGKSVLLSAISQCAGSPCSDCGKKCNTDEGANIIWGPTEIVSGTGSNATTIPLWQKETIWAIFIDPVTGCRDTVYQELYVNCSDPTVPIIKLENTSFCSSALPGTITATTKGLKGPCTYEWTTTWGAPETTTIPTLTIPANLKNCHTVRVKVTDNGYTPAKTAYSSAEVCIYQTPPVFTIIASQTEVCVGDTVSLQASDYVPNLLYKWDVEGGTVSDHWNGTATGQVLSTPCKFILTASDRGAEAQKCKQSAEINVSAHLVTAQIKAISGFECGNMCGTLSASSSSCSQRDNIVSYEWGPPAGIDGSTTNATVTTKLTNTTTTFYVNVKDRYGCSGHADLTVSDGICEVIVSGDTLCVYDGLINREQYAYPFVTVKGGTPTFRWTSTLLSVSNGTTANPKFHISGKTAGDYPVSVAVSDGITTQTYSTIVRLLAPPTVTISTQSTSVCVGEEIKFTSTVTPASNSYKYYWLYGASGPEKGTTATAVMGTPGKNTYSLKIENQYGCFNYGNVSVTALAHAFPCATSVCTDASNYEARIEILSGQTPYTLYSDAAQTIPVAGAVWNPAQNSVTVPGLNSDQAYSFFLQGPNLCKSEEVQVFQTCACNVGAFLNSDSTTCSNPKDTLNVYVNTWGATYYSFDLIAPDGSVALSVNREKGKRWAYPATIPNSGTYTLRNFNGYSDASDLIGCTGEVYENATIRFLQKADFTLSAHPTEVCVGDTVTLTAKGIKEGFTLEWNTSQGSLILQPTATTTAACIASSDNTFTLTVKDQYNCATEQQVQVKGHEVKAGAITTIPPLGFACNAAGTLSLSSANCNQSGCPLRYAWTPTNMLQTTNTATVTTQPLGQSTAFSVTVSDNLGCKDSAKITVNVGLCDVEVVGDTLCVYQNSNVDSVALPLVKIKGGYTHVAWTDKSGSGLHFKNPSSVSPSVNISGIPAGVYPIEVAISDLFSTQTYPTTIVIVGNPKVNIASDKTTACVGESVQLTATPTPQNEKHTYYWLHGASGKEHSQTATAIVSRSGDNRYIVKIEDEHKCYSYDTITVKGLKEVFLCAESQCIDEHSYKTQIKVLGGIAPYQMFSDIQLTTPAIGTWNNSVFDVNGQTSGQIYSYHLSGNNLCNSASIEVVKECGCTQTTPCNAGLFLEENNSSCHSDTAKIHIQAWGAATYSFRLVDPDGNIVLSVRQEEGTEWTWASPTYRQGAYTIEGFTGYTLTADSCTGKVFGNVYLNTPEPIVLEAGEDKFICAGESVILNATGNVCSFTWNCGVTNGQPFVPVANELYIVEGVSLNGCTTTDSLRLEISPSIQIILQSDDIKVEKGEKAMFFVQTIPAVPATFLWQQEIGQQWHTLTDQSGSPQISGSKTVRLSVENIPMTWNKSRLRCIAQNHCGTDTAYFNIVVTGCLTGGAATLQMEQGITPDEVPGDAIDGWYCRGVRIGVRALVSGISKDEKLIYHWTVDGIPVDYSQTDYISWVPAMWEDDIILKVCVYSPNYCDMICAKYIRLKSRAFENPIAKIVTSIDPQRTFCPGEVIHLAVSSKNLGQNPEYQWYNDIFNLGDGSVKTVLMEEDDSWFRLEVKVSDDICVKNRLLTDTIHLIRGKTVTPTLSIALQPNDSLYCHGDNIILNAKYSNAGIAPLISWNADGWSLGTGFTKQLQINEKDTWIQCTLTPSDDVCSTLDTIRCYKQVKVVSELPSVTITSDQQDKQEGDAVTFTASLSFPLASPQYRWLINDKMSYIGTSSFIASHLQRGDWVKCLVSGNKACQKDITSNTIEIKFAIRSRDTLLSISKNESLSKLSIAQPGDENYYFEIATHAENGRSTLSVKGIFQYIPHKDFVGGDHVEYLLRHPQTREIIASGTINITVSDNEKFAVPNIITPNGDGINDEWIIEFLEAYPENTVSIYNRQGNLVYYSQNYKNDFKGFNSLNGKMLISDIYTYVITLNNDIKLISWLEIRRDLFR